MMKNSDSDKKFSLFESLRWIFQILTFGILWFLFQHLQYPPVIVLLGALILVWLLNQRFRWRWLPSYIFATQILMITTGFLLHFSHPWLVLATIVAISSWDLDVYNFYLGEVNWVKDRRLIENDHIKRLLVFCLFGFGLAYLPLNISLSIKFTTAVILSVIAILGLTRVIKLFNEWVKTSSR